MTKAPFTLRGHNPDILTSIANLSNDEVFTPPELANTMLDLTQRLIQAVTQYDLIGDPGENCGHLRMVDRFLVHNTPDWLSNVIAIGLTQVYAIEQGV